MDTVEKQMNVVNTKKLGEDCSGMYEPYKKWGGYDYSCSETEFISTTDGITYAFACGYVSFVEVDVNGPQKGPNVFGRDLFRFEVDLSKNKVIPSGAGQSKYNCSATNLTADCTAKVLIEGKMNY